MRFEQKRFSVVLWGDPALRTNVVGEATDG